MAAGAGWYANPGGKGNTFRWWNGEAWTRWLSADPTAAAPGPEPRPIEPAPAPVVERVPSGPLGSAALPPPPKVVYDNVTRKVSYEEMQFIAPGPPFHCDPEPQEAPGLFTSGFSCSALVHAN